MFLENPIDFPGQLSLLTDSEDVFDDLVNLTRVSTGAAISVIADSTSVSFYRGKLTEEELAAHGKQASENALLDDFYFPIF